MPSKPKMPIDKGFAALDTGAIFIGAADHSPSGSARQIGLRRSTCLVKSSPTCCNAIASRQRAQKSLKTPETRPFVVPQVHDPTYPRTATGNSDEPKYGRRAVDQNEFLRRLKLSERSASAGYKRSPFTASFRGLIYLLSDCREASFGRAAAGTTRTCCPSAADPTWGHI